MAQVLVYFLIFGSILYFLSSMGKKQRGSLPVLENDGKPTRWFKAKRDPQEIWVQVYEIATLAEARILQARIQEEELDCIVYEQGKKDIHGNELTGIGIAVPKTSVPRAQSIISRMPV